MGAPTIRPAVETFTGTALLDSGNPADDGTASITTDGSAPPAGAEEASTTFTNITERPTGDVYVPADLLKLAGDFLATVGERTGLAQLFVNGADTTANVKPTRLNVGSRDNLSMKGGSGTVDILSKMGPLGFTSNIDIETFSDVSSFKIGGGKKTDFWLTIEKAKEGEITRIEQISVRLYINQEPVISIKEYEIEFTFQNGIKVSIDAKEFGPKRILKPTSISVSSKVAGKRHTTEFAVTEDWEVSYTEGENVIHILSHEPIKFINNALKLASHGYFLHPDLFRKSTTPNILPHMVIDGRLIPLGEPEPTFTEHPNWVTIDTGRGSDRLFVGNITSIRKVKNRDGRLQPAVMTGSKNGPITLAIIPQTLGGEKMLFGFDKLDVVVTNPPLAVDMGKIVITDGGKEIVYYFSMESPELGGGVYRSAKGKKLINHKLARNPEAFLELVLKEAKSGRMTNIQEIRIPPLAKKGR